MTFEEKLKQRLAVLEEENDKLLKSVEVQVKETISLYQKRNWAEAQSFLKTQAMLDAQRETLVLAAKNKMLLVALSDIKKVVEDSQDKQNPSYFDLDAKDAVFILDTIENALLWSQE